MDRGLLKSSIFTVELCLNIFFILCLLCKNLARHLKNANNTLRFDLRTMGILYFEVTILKMDQKIDCSIMDEVATSLAEKNYHTSLFDGRILLVTDTMS